MATLIVVTILGLPMLKLTDVASTLDWIFLVFPCYNLGASFNNLYTNAMTISFCSADAIQFACKTGLNDNPCCKGNIESI